MAEVQLPEARCFYGFQIAMEVSSAKTVLLSRTAQLIVFPFFPLFFLLFFLPTSRTFTLKCTPV